MTPEITEYFDLDSEYGRIATPCLGIPGRKEKPTAQTENNPTPKNYLPLINYDSPTHKDLTSGRVNFRKPDPRYQGVGFPVLNQFSGLGHKK